MEILTSSSEPMEMAIIPTIHEDADEAAEALSRHLMTDDSLHDFLRRARKTPLLTAEQEVELAKAVEAGMAAEMALGGHDTFSQYGNTEELRQIAHQGCQAKELLINANILLVVSCAGKYFPWAAVMEKSDIVQEGIIGLIRAVEKFDYMQGYKLSTYAAWWIESHVSREMGLQNGNVKLPIPEQELRATIKNIQAHWRKAHITMPTAEEIWSQSNTRRHSLAQIEACLHRMRWSPMQDNPRDEDGGIIESIIVDPQGEAAIAKLIFWETLAQFMIGLTDQQRSIIEGRLLRERSVGWKALAADNKITEGRARTIFAELVTELRQWLTP